MKKIAIFIIIQTFVITQIYCQDQRADVYTPKGYDVEAWTRSPDYLTSWRNYYDNYFTNAYPNATKINTYGGYSTTKKFNCHGYAWHVSEGGAYRWIGYTQYNRDEAVYWEDPNHSYIQIGSQYYPGGKVSYGDYGNYDHSATVADPSTYGTGWFVSKWGDKVLMRHAYNDCPYYSTNLKYYKLNPSTITGSTSVLCNNVQRTFSTDITHMPSATLSWTKTWILSYVSGAGTPNYTVKGSSNNDIGTVYFQITTPSGFTWSSSKNMWVGKPEWNGLMVRDYYTKEMNPTLCMGDDNYLEVFSEASSSQQIDEYGWNLISGGSLYVLPGSPYDVTLIVPFSSSVSFQYKAHNTCGWTNYRNNTLWASYCGYFYSYTPNPVSDELTIEAVALSSEVVKEADSDISTEFEAVLFNTDQKRVKEGKSNENKIKLNVSDLKKGSYFLHIIDENQVKKEQIIIE